MGFGVATTAMIKLQNYKKWEDGEKGAVSYENQHSNMHKRKEVAGQQMQILCYLCITSVLI